MPIFLYLSLKEEFATALYIEGIVSDISSPELIFCIVSNFYAEGYF
jgi:hypothetical protein